MRLAWLWRSDDLGRVQPWDAVIAERHALATERLLLGAAGRSRVVGNRRDEAIVAEREQRAAAMRERARQRPAQAAERPKLRKVG